MPGFTLGRIRARQAVAGRGRARRRLGGRGRGAAADRAGQRSRRRRSALLRSGARHRRRRAGMPRSAPAADARHRREACPSRSSCRRCRRCWSIPASRLQPRRCLPAGRRARRPRRWMRRLSRKCPTARRYAVHRGASGTISKRPAIAMAPVVAEVLAAMRALAGCALRACRARARPALRCFLPPPPPAPRPRTSAPDFRTGGCMPARWALRLFNKIAIFLLYPGDIRAKVFRAFSTTSRRVMYGFYMGLRM